MVPNAVKATVLIVLVGALFGTYLYINHLRSSLQASEQQVEQLQVVNSALRDTVLDLTTNAKRLQARQQQARRTNAELQRKLDEALNTAPPVPTTCPEQMKWIFDRIAE